MLINGVWRLPVNPTSYTGIPDAVFRCEPTLGSVIVANPTRFSVYASLACPWSHQVIAMWALNELSSFIPLYIVHPVIGRDGWTFKPGDRVVNDDSTQFIRSLYTQTKSDYTGCASLPLLWDTQANCIVTNHSEDCMKILNACGTTLGRTPDYYPDNKHGLINTVSTFIRHYVYEAIYKTGAAETQLAYEESVTRVFDALNEIDLLLEQSPFSVGQTMTITDCQLWAILIRFDAVYYSLFNCNQKHAWDYPYISRYIQTIYQLPGIRDTVSLDHIQSHYYASPRYKNPATIVPVGPQLPWLVTL